MIFSMICCELPTNKAVSFRTPAQNLPSLKAHRSRDMNERETSNLNDTDKILVLPVHSFLK